MTAKSVSTLSLGSDVSELSKMNLWLDETLCRLKLSEHTCHAIQLCLSEIVTNVILYGRPGEQGITISVERLDDGVTVCIVDDGRPFDPIDFVPEPKPLTLEDAKIGGHGLRLVRKFTTAMSYDRSNNLNCLKLSFAL